MGRLLLQKLLLLIILVPLLNLGAFYYQFTRPEPAGATAGMSPQELEFRNNAPRLDFLTAYKDYLHNSFNGDLGFDQRVPIGRFFGHSLVLLTVALLTVLVLGPLLGLMAISRRNGRISGWALIAFTIGSAIPGFFLATVLVVLMIMSSRLGWYTGKGFPLPTQGYGLDTHLVIPTLALASRSVFYVGYITAGLLENELQQDYIRVARSKGLPWRLLLWRHALPNVTSAVLAALGFSFQFVVGGLIVVEPLFDWRGIIWLGFGDIHNTYTLAFIVTFFGAVLLIANMVASILAYIADPRVRKAPRAVSA